MSRRCALFHEELKKFSTPQTKKVLEMTSEVIIDVQPKEISIALLEDKNLVEYQNEKREEASYSVGNIYLGRVRKLMPGLNACFVEVGSERDAFLHYLDLGTQFSSYEKYLKQVQSDKKKLYPISKATRQPDLPKDGSVQTAKEFFKLNKFGASTLTAEEQRNLYTYMGSEDPKCSGGIINNLEYKDWTLGINVIFNLGMKVRVQPSYSPTYYDRGLNTNHDILNRWTPTNTNTDMPALMVNTTARASEFTHFSEYNTYSMLDTWVKSCSTNATN